MSHVTNELDSLLRERGTVPAQLAAKSGIAAPQISRIRNGVQNFISLEDMVSIANAMGKGYEDTNRIHARLLYARLRDECTGPGASLITITLSENPRPMELRDEPASDYTVPPRIRQNLTTLGQYVSKNPKDRHIKQMINTLADLCEKKNLDPGPEK